MSLKLIIVLLIPLVLIAAWVAGARRMQTRLEPHLIQVVPGTVELKPLGDGSFAAQADERVVGYARVDQANGYGGPMRIAVGIDTTGTIAGVTIVDHKETEAYFRKVLSGNGPGSFVGRHVSDPIEPGVDVDAVTGATQSNLALVTGVRQGARTLGTNQLGFDVPAADPVRFRFGWAEIVLLMLFVTGFAGTYTQVPGKKPLRWISQIAALVLIGFVYAIPITLTHINSLLVGYLPDWRTQFYWYLLIIGVLLPVLLTGKRPYCGYVCPFGAVQDCLGAVGGRRKKIPEVIQRWLGWFHAVLVFAAIFVALYTRNPGLTSYEVQGSLFDLTGLLYQFVVLGVVLVLSLFIARPWCRFLCPINGVTRYIKTARSSWRNRAK
ncbi:MAG: 4Fe-4S binding protein [Candidatus Latescibacterota bacterium]|nr:MAG: 4Fe-4S binding protein [Candidatus Latescibacterota bacterium]